MITTLLRRSIRLAPAAVLLAVVASLSCRMVTDSATGIDLSATDAHHSNQCRKQCEQQFQAGVKAENQRFRNAVRACGSSKSCRKSEQLTHKNNLDQLRNQERDCRRSCYNEGAGQIR